MNEDKKNEGGIVKESPPFL